MISYSILFDGRSLNFARSVSLIDKLSLIWLYCDETGDFTVINYPLWCSSWSSSNTSWSGALFVESRLWHYIDVIMTTMASQITSLTFVYSTFYSDADQRKHQSSASLAFLWGIHRDRWNPRTKDQLRGKGFHLMTSSCWALPVQTIPAILHSKHEIYNVLCIKYNYGWQTKLLNVSHFLALILSYHSVRCWSLKCIWHYIVFSFAK